MRFERTANGVGNAHPRSEDVPEAYANRDVPFEKVVHAVRGLREGSTAPLFQVMFVLQNLEEHAIPLGPQELITRFDGDGTSDLTLFLAAKPEGMQAVMDILH